MRQDLKLSNIYGFNDKNGRYDLPVGGDFNCVLSKKDRRGAGEDFEVDKTTGLL